MEPRQRLIEIKPLQGCINDLISVQALPVIWSGQDSPHMAATLLEVLVRLLHLDFAYARLNDSIDGSPVELVRFPHKHAPPAQAEQIARALDCRLAANPTASRLTVPNPIGKGAISIAPLRLGLQDEIGILVAASQRIEFPSDTDMLLLRVAANQGVIALQEARRVKEKARAAEELERQVVERTSQLIAVNEKLQAEMSERLRAEEEALALKDELAAELKAMTRLHEFSTRLLAPTELQSLLDEVLNATMTLQNADFGNVQLYNSHSQALEIVAHRGFRKDFLEYFSKVHDARAVCGRAMHQRQRVIVEDVLADPLFEPHRKIAASAGFRAVQSTPLFSRSGEPLGMISTHFRRVHRPSEHELRLTDLYAYQAAEMIERKRAEEALRASEERFRLLVDGVKDYAIFMLDPDGSVVTWNNAAERIKGYRAPEILGKHFSLFYEPSDIQLRKPEQALKTAAETGRFEEEGWRLRKSGTRLWANVIITPLKDEKGTLQGFVTVTRDMTERKRAEEKLRRNEAYLAEGQRLSHTGSWAWNVSSNELFWSVEHFRIFGLNPKNDQPTYEKFFALVHPDDRARVRQTFDSAVREKRDYDCEYWIIRPDGDVRHIHGLAHPVFTESRGLTEYVGTVLDDTERRKAEESLRKAHERVEMILESITDKFFAVDREWRYTHFNRHAEEQLKVLGKNPASTLGKTLWEEFPNPPTEEVLRRAMSQRVAITHEHYYAPLGEWVENRIYPSPDGGLAMFVRYVTERKRAEEALHRAQAELAHVSRVTTMGEFVASIAHEVNQPLGAIANNGNACLRILSDAPACPVEARECLADIVKDAIRASAIITRIRALTKKSTSERTSLRLEDVIADVLALAHHEMAKRGIIIRTEFEPNLPNVSGDRVQLQQVLLNLVINGTDAMTGVEEKNRLMTIREQRDASEGKPGVLLTVEDSGRGLNMEDLDRLFEPFYTTKPHGMGMGLRISRSIVEAHGGRLWATPNAGPGATFSFTLPAENGEAGSAAAPAFHHQPLLTTL